MKTFLGQKEVATIVKTKVAKKSSTITPRYGYKRQKSQISANEVNFLSRIETLYTRNDNIRYKIYRHQQLKPIKNKILCKVR